MTLLLRPVDMSYRGSFPSDHWNRHGTGRGLSVSSAGDVRGFSRSSHLDDMVISPPTSQARLDRYSIPGPSAIPSPYSANTSSPLIPSGMDPHSALFSPPPNSMAYGGVGLMSMSTMEKYPMEYDAGTRSSPDHYQWEEESPTSWQSPDYGVEASAPRGSSSGSRASGKMHSQRRPSNRDEFDGPHQFLDRPPMEIITAQEQDLPHLPTNLYVNEQDEILSRVNDCLSKCAFDFVAKYQFPIPLEPDKRPVRQPADREWTEWVYLLKRLATKRRIPARVLYNGQIKQLVTVLENSLEMRHAAKHQSRPLKDDRNVLQLISAGIQVARILKDSLAMSFLDNLYIETEKMIQSRKSNPLYLA